jgi:hypothetical protein
MMTAGTDLRRFAEMATCGARATDEGQGEQFVE